MKALLQKLTKFLAYLAAGAVILLAIAVGLFRLLLPRLPAYQEEIKSWANAAIGMQVEFSGMNARWRFSGPELNFYNAELRMPGADGGAFAADEVSIGVDLMQLIIDRRFVVDSVLLRDSAVNVRRDDDGNWRLQDIAIGTLSESFAGETGGEIELTVEDVDVSYRHPPTAGLVEFTINRLRVARTPGRVSADALLSLPAGLGNRLSLGLSARPDANTWQVSIDSRDLRVAGWSQLQPEGLPALGSGLADLSGAVELVDGALRNAVLEFDVEQLTVAGDDEPFGGEGRLEYEADDAGWLLAGDGFRLRSEGSAWPDATFSVQGATNSAGELTSLSAAASYVDLDDVERLQPWLPPRAADLLEEYAPTGRLADLTLTLQELGRDRPRYDLAVELSEAGILSSERFPGVSGFSGSLRANRSGGRVEIDSDDLTLDLQRWMESPLAFASAQGTVIWRRNLNGTIVLSDSIRVQNADLTSRNSVQLSLPADGSSPVLDVESRFSIYDLAAARDYLPGRVMNPQLYDWLRNALVDGAVPTGVARFSGPLAEFPFDDGNGVFRVEARLQNATLRYSDQWPDIENLDMDVVVDRTRLYSERNTAINAGNTVVDATIEIADLREPVLTIDAFATGTLESVHRFAQQSPISQVFGGQLDRVSVGGDASFTLDLTYPLRRRDEFVFTTRLQTSDGVMRVGGFDPPITELNGIVVISRDSIAAEALFGRFLGEPVSIELRRAGEDLPGVSVIAEAEGRASAEGLAAGFGANLDAVIDGDTSWRASLRFPAANSETPAPFSIDVESTLVGMSTSLPPPFAKERDEARRLLSSVEFPSGGRIETRGSLDDALRWTLAFVDGDDGWDFDRGVLAVGGSYPEAADTRGLHIVGDVGDLRLSDWLDAAGGRGDGQAGAGVASRIRSIDLNVQNLYALGQHYREHRVVVDRSGSDWRVQLDGELARGSISIPYDLRGERAVALDMERLILPGAEGDAGGEAPISADPRQVPAVTLRAAEFAFGDRHLGRVSADFARTPDGLVAQGVTAEDATFRVSGSAGWVVDTREPSGQRTWVDASLSSTDVAETMRRLDTKAGIVGGDMQLGFDVSWSGGPRSEFLTSLDGDVAVRFGPGQLDEIDPGAGRVFGLLSVVALPRRLALDFRDVLDRGFAFDEITGNFRLDDGAAYTCDLSLKGPAADIGIVGRTGLVAKDYTQTAIVSANVGNTLPVVGAVVAGPQVAAALLIFSQIFKKPLQEMGQVYYAIEGNWDQPQVEPANAGRFAEISRMAGCLEANE